MSDDTEHLSQSDDEQLDDGETVDDDFDFGNSTTSSEGTVSGPAPDKGTSGSDRG